MPKSTQKLAIAFPGQGSYHPSVLGELYRDYPGSRESFDLADKICRRFFGCEFSPLVAGTSSETHDALLVEHPYLDQVGIFLTEVALGEILLEKGVRPSILVGHSFGELAALATAGVFDIESGIRIVCQRVAALESLQTSGKMAAISCDTGRARQLLGDLGDHGIEISVINHPRQTVVSGPEEDLERLRNSAAGVGVSATILKSRYPFHSSHLGGAVAFFDACLRSYEFRPPRFPVYLCTERKLLGADVDLAEVLSTQFVKPLDFEGIVRELAGEGYRSFIECGAGDIASNIIRKNLAAGDELIAEPTALPSTGVKSGLDAILGVLEKAGMTGGRNGSGGVEDLIGEVTKTVGKMARFAGDAIAMLGRVNFAPPKDAAGEGVTADEPSAARDQEMATAAEAKVYPEENCSGVPIAIVSQGCVLPGAASPEEYWDNIINGVCGIVDLAVEDPHARHDFMAGTESKIISDKTYTLLNGSILNVGYPGDVLSGYFSEEEFEKLSRGQKLLAVALGQTLKGMGAGVALDPNLRVECILGATADGSEEFDDALFADQIHARAAKSSAPGDSIGAFSAALERATGYKIGDSEGMAQHEMYCGVVEKFFRRKIKTYIVDTACSSSLYSTDFGIKSLRSHDSDLVLAGGVFAPGPANNTLFAQFRGLTPNGSRPLDASADGVVFGDGSGIIALKRLPDAMGAGDKILAVIRGIGLSSDGKSPSVNVPQPDGQSIAVRRAYATSGVDISTTQYVEAHATSTPVGDAAEFKGLREIFAARDGALPPVELGSVKSLIGHTGWASGVASVIKFCKAFEHGLAPRQFLYESPNAGIDLEGSPFRISKETHPWEKNVSNLPWRAGINSFGFGGTNAHLIMEAFDEGYHTHLCDRIDAKPPKRGPLAIVGVGDLFPKDDPANSDSGGPHQFNRSSMRLPAKKMLLPDVTDHMDPGQYLAALAAEKIFGSFPDRLGEMSEEIGVVIGLTSKTERGVRANERVFLDRLKRMVGDEANGDAGILGVLEGVAEEIGSENIPSGPYTLPGLMPNVTASRISSLYDLKGPNIVVDRGDDSLTQALVAAESLLVDDDCKLVLAGGINAYRSVDGTSSEAAVLLGLTTMETARSKGFDVIGQLDLSDHSGPEGSGVGNSDDAIYRGAGGAPQIRDALDVSGDGTPSCISGVNGRDTGAGSVLEIRIGTTTKAKPKTAGPGAGGNGPKSPAATEGGNGAYAFVEGTPIHTMTPSLWAEAPKLPGVSFEGKRILFLTDQPESWKILEGTGALAALDHRILCPAAVDVPGATRINLTNGEVSEASVGAALEGESYDAIVAVSDLTVKAGDALLESEMARECALVDLLFAVCKYSYGRISEGEVSVASVCLGAYKGEALDPHTGVIGGFVKSLSRELPAASCRAINTDSGNFMQAMRCVEVELGQDGSDCEVCYKGGQRHIFKLSHVGQLSSGGRRWIDKDSVVIATGGGRGVTAVLGEQLLEETGCTVIALGRTNISGVPEKYLEMSELEFKDFEPEFYREELGRDKSQKIKDLKAKYWSYQAANELHQVIKRLDSLPGTFEYVAVDINDGAAVEKLVSDVTSKHGNVDTVIHGAGIQVSKVIPKKSLDLFRRIVSTKLASLGSLYRACRKSSGGKPVHFHLLTSAFSYLGNDGQPDYGAANEAMNRIAALMDKQEPAATWSSMAWLGWAGIGMTRGTEFAALAANRRLRGVTKEEGRDIFGALVEGKPTYPINILMADGEIDFYKAKIAKSDGKPTIITPKPERDEFLEEVEFTVENAPYLLDHLVHGTPTLPGAFIIGMVADVARKLRPHLKIAAFEDTNFLKFVSVYKDRGIKLRLDARVVSAGEEDTVIRVQVLSDFIHKSGAILQKDVCHTEIFVRMTAEVQGPPERTLNVNGFSGLQLPDPYVMSRSPVRLNGQFKSMRQLEVGDEFRKARYKLADSPYPESRFSYLLPNVIMVDAFWRFGTVEVKENHTLSVFVPRRCKVMRVLFDYTDFGMASLADEFMFHGTNPRVDGDLLQVGPIEVRNTEGKVMLIVEGGECVRFGDIENAY